MTKPITCFKAYDIRGELNSQLDEATAYRIGYAFAEELKAKTVRMSKSTKTTFTKTPVVY